MGAQLNIVIGIVVIAMIVIIGFLIFKKSTPSPFSTNRIIDALGRGNIRDVNYTRNKINVDLKSSSVADMQALKAEGAKGINIVGDQVKFYFEGKTKTVYEGLRHDIERDV